MLVSKAIYKWPFRRDIPCVMEEFRCQDFPNHQSAPYKKIKKNNKSSCEIVSPEHHCYIQNALMPNDNHARSRKILLPLVAFPLFFLPILDHSYLPSSPAVMYKKHRAEEQIIQTIKLLLPAGRLPSMSKEK